MKSYVVFKAEPQPYAVGGAFWWQRVGACRSRADAAQLAALLLLDAAILGVWVREAEAGPAEAPAPDAGAPA
jgi:type IV secretory pathway TrbF-like protein